MPSSHANQAYHPRHGQHVHVARAAEAVHGTLSVALPQLFQFLIIFAVHVRVSVHATYMIYHAGSSVIPVFIVRLL